MGNYYNRVYTRVILGLYWDNGKENGNYHNRVDIRAIIGHILG